MDIFFDISNEIGYNNYTLHRGTYIQCCGIYVLHLLDGTVHCAFSARRPHNNSDLRERSATRRRRDDGYVAYDNLNLS